MRTVTVNCLSSALTVSSRGIESVPAMPSIYGTLDKHLDHFRRYDREPLRQLLSETGFEVESLRYLNQPGVFGWWLNSRVLKRRVIPRAQVGAVRWLMPWLRAESRRSPAFGESVAAADAIELIVIDIVARRSSTRASSRSASPPCRW